MNAEIKKLWLEELRSGWQIQGQGRLMNVRGEKCCLGVLCEIHRTTTDAGFWTESNHYQSIADEDQEERWYLPVFVMEWAGLHSANPEVEGFCLSNHNDGVNTKRKNFFQIANLIEEYL